MIYIYYTLVYMWKLMSTSVHVKTVCGRCLIPYVVCRLQLDCWRYIYYENLCAHCNKAIKIAALKIFISFGRDCLDVFVREFYQFSSMVTSLQAIVVQSAPFFGRAFILYIYPHFFFFASPYSFKFNNKIWMYNFLCLSPSACFIRCCAVSVCACVFLLCFADWFNGFDPKACVRWWWWYIHKNMFDIQVFPFGVGKSSFWLIADAKIQKITLSLKYLMKKEVCIGCKNFDASRQTGQTERKRKMKSKMENEIQIWIKKSNEYFFSSLLFYFFTSVHFSLV